MAEALPLDFTDPRATPFAPIRSRGELPHFYKEGCTYFVTFRLRDAVTPAATASGGRRRTAEEIAAASEPPLRLGSCLLADPRAATIVGDALTFFDGERYHLHAWCVMPNHCHAVYTPLGESVPEDIHHSWKSFTAHRINRLLRRRGPLWERESFDHLVRSVEDADRFVRYVEENPIAADLCRRPEDWPYGSAGRPK